VESVVTRATQRFGRLRMLFLVGIPVGMRPPCGRAANYYAANTPRTGLHFASQRS
jgi:hypothetical protein